MLAVAANTISSKLGSCLFETMQPSSENDTQIILNLDGKQVLNDVILRFDLEYDIHPSTK
jgi:hypothetical protein